MLFLSYWEMLSLARFSKGMQHKKYYYLKTATNQTTPPKNSTKTKPFKIYSYCMFQKVSRLNIHLLFSRPKNSAAWPWSWPGSCFPWSEASLYRPIISLFRRRELWLEAGTGPALPDVCDLLVVLEYLPTKF